MPEIRVLIVDDHAILRDGIRSLLERQGDIRVTGEASNGREAIEQIARCAPDIVLMDIAMPEMNGLEATQKIKELYPGVKVLILTQHDNREYTDPVLKAGASGYVLKRSGGKEVIHAIHQVYNQGAYLEASITRQVLDDYQHFEEKKDPEVPYLTEREWEVLRLVVEGKNNKEIARIFSISPKTVSVHRSNIMTKLNTHNSFELMRYIQQHRLFQSHR
jgi:two-component system nitrate/nitrite response regulator NarL